jgi:hypothetical protein
VPPPDFLAYHASHLPFGSLRALLVLYHRASPGAIGRPNPEQVLLDEVRRLYKGDVVTGHDLDVF